MKSQTSFSGKRIQREKHYFDARGQILGRLAQRVSTLLIGKGKKEYVPHLDLGDEVVVSHASEIAVSGKKEKDKLYFRYSGYPSGLKRESLSALRKRRPTEILRHAVSGMLPQNRLKKRRLARLMIYEGDPER